MLQRSKKRCFALLVSLCLLASGALAQTTVTGRLLDDADGKPVTSGIVRLLDSLSKTVDFTYTQADGRFKLELTSGGRYTLSLEAMGYAAATREVEVKPGEVQFLPLGDVRLLSSETAI